MFDVKWSGTTYALCRGSWTIKKNGKDYTKYIPKELITNNMNTYGIYTIFSFNYEWEEEWNDYENGLNCDEWIEKNNYWISKICDNESEKSELFHAIQKCDWRYGQCGACI